MKRLLLVVLGTISLSVVGAAAACAQDLPRPALREMKLRPGDMIKLKIWQEEELSGEFSVPENGRVVFPKIGERQVVGVTTSSLRELIVSEFRKYLRAPGIDVTFHHRVNVLGAVREPGLVFVNETMSVADAVALAGGTEPEGKSDQVELYRGTEKVVTRITHRTRISELPLESGDQLFVPERSWFARNTTVVAALFSGVVSVIVANLVANK